MENSSLKIAFPGVYGSYSEAAVRACYPNADAMSCPTFAPALKSVLSGQADLAVVPVENIIAGRVAEMHTLLPTSGLHIVGEHFQPIEHHLLVVPGAKLGDIKRVVSHIQALSQCSVFIARHNIESIPHIDTAGAAEEIAQTNDLTIAAIASARAGELYKLESLAADIADQPNNMTRFLVLAREAVIPPVDTPCMMTLAFTLRSVPAALYKALGGFATNGINLTRIESHISHANFTSAGFTIDVEGRPDEVAMSRALDDLRHFTDSLTILGTYPQAAWRLNK